MEGINLISSTYSDDDDEMEDGDQGEPLNDDKENQEDYSVTKSEEERVTVSENGKATPPHAPMDDASGPGPAPRSRSVTPLKPQPPLSSPHPRSVGSGRLTIVDYGHDEVAMSPEAEEGEIAVRGVASMETQPQTANGNENVALSAAQITSSGVEAATPLQELLDGEPKSTAVEEPVKDSVDGLTDDDLVARYMPPLPTAKCSDEQQERINKFLYLKRLGKSYNAEVRKKKEYRNPDFLRHAVTYQGIDEIGSCFEKHVHDPHGYDKSDYYDEIGTSTIATSGLRAVPTAVDSAARDGRQNKKSKWDKVDGDQKITMPSGGHDSVSKAGAHAALLAAANAGTGYTAFAAQQRRRDTEEKRYSEKKMDRRS